MDRIRYKRALDRFNRALNEMKAAVGEDNFNFVGAVTVFDENGEATDDCTWYAIGDVETSIVSAECLVEEIEDENNMDNLLSQVNLN